MKVFVSYAHRDNRKAEVGQLLEWLNEQEGVEAIADLQHSDRAPPQGWQAWMLHSIEDADMVLCVCGEAYKNGFEKRGGGMGSTWEGAIITADLYENRGWNEKYYPILLEAGAHLFVPAPLKPWDNNIAFFSCRAPWGMPPPQEPSALLEAATFGSSSSALAPRKSLPQTAPPHNKHTQETRTSRVACLRGA